MSINVFSPGRSCSDPHEIKALYLQQVGRILQVPQPGAASSLLLEITLGVILRIAHLDGFIDDVRA